MIEVEGLTKCFGEFTDVDHISLQVAKEKNEHYSNPKSHKIFPGIRQGSESQAIMQTIVEERNLDDHQLAQNAVRGRFTPFSSSSEVTI